MVLIIRLLLCERSLRLWVSSCRSGRYGCSVCAELVIIVSNSTSSASLWSSVTDGKSVAQKHYSFTAVNKPVETQPVSRGADASPGWSTVHDFRDDSCAEYILKWCWWDAVTTQNSQGVHLWCMQINTFHQSKYRSFISEWSSSILSGGILSVSLKWIKLELASDFGGLDRRLYDILASIASLGSRHIG